MVIPTQKVSIMRRNRRHAIWQRSVLKKLSNAINVVKCSNCGADKLAHRVCKVCWYYGNQQVLTIKTKSKEKILEA